MTRLAGKSAMNTGSARISGRGLAATFLRDRTPRVFADTDPAEIAHFARAPSARAIAVPLDTAKGASSATTPALRARGLEVYVPPRRRDRLAGGTGPLALVRRITDG